MPIFAIIIATLFLGEQTSLLGWIGVLLAMIGIGLLNYEGLRSLDLEMLMLIIIPISSAVFFVFQKPLLKTLRSYEVMFYSILVGTLVLLVLDHSFLIVIPKAAISTNLAAIYLGLIPTAIAFNLWAYVLSKLEVSYTSRYLYLVPVFTVFFSFIILNQIPKQNVLLGGGIILFGVYLSQRK
ncbi:MAG: hypothetical protein ED557_05380 [Balneola sp.]|nr:MAG: hypothetical protein ED557_05380 [Balneola sp.]